MQNLLERDFGTSLLSITIILGTLGLFFVFLRILTISIKKILEAIFRKSWLWNKSIIDNQSYHYCNNKYNDLKNVNSRQG